MILSQKIIETYPELKNKDFAKIGIFLRNDSDGLGDYIEKWNYEKPIPVDLTVGKPKA
jgi:hypothetical protein